MYSKKLKQEAAHCGTSPDQYIAALNAACPAHDRHCPICGQFRRKTLAGWRCGKLFSNGDGGYEHH